MEKNVDSKEDIHLLGMRKLKEKRKAITKSIGTLAMKSLSFWITFGQKKLISNLQSPPSMMSLQNS